MFLEKEIHTFILEGRKEKKLGTCDSRDEKCKFCMKECRYVRDSVLFKEWLRKEKNSETLVHEKKIE
jgi:hypothetical protein